MVIFFFMLACVLSVYACLPLWTDAYIVPKWLFGLLAVGGMGIVQGLRLLKRRRRHDSAMYYIGAVAAISAVLALHGVLQRGGILPSLYSQGQPIGCFDNAAGYAGCLSVGIPFCLFLSERVANKRIKYLGYGLYLLGFVAVCLSQSRAGVIALLASFAAYLYLRCRAFRKKWVLGLVFCFLFLLLFGSYHLKKGSADGRLLIWQVTIEMIKDKPFTGHGVGAVEARYMDYQASFFASHPHSPYIMLGDNVKQVFNEYLALSVRYGLVGWLVLLAVLVVVWRSYRQHPTSEGRVAVCSLVGVGVCACFSYPCTYPFVWMVLALDIYLIVRATCTIGWKSKWVRKVVGLVMVACCGILIYKVWLRMDAETEWGEVSTRSLQGETEQMLPCYEKLLPVLGNVPYFLYNYAAELYVSGHYREAFHVANRCRAYWADYDLELLQGEISKSLGDMESAKAHFMLASSMCPVRFVPLFRLYDRECGDTTRMRSMGQQILDKPIKVDSHTVWQIKQRVRRDLEKE